MRFDKYHALGNAYLLLGTPTPPSAALVTQLCDVHVGIGADGVLHLDQSDDDGAALLRVFNPDGSEAQTSGNGVRIAARWLWDHGCAPGGLARLRTSVRSYACEVAPDGASVSVPMGRADFQSSALPMTGPEREVIDEPLELDGDTLRVSAVSMGNPHVVLFTEAPADEVIARWGAALECHPWFPERTNVQAVNVAHPGELRVAVWERGAGITPSSGSSAAAVAALARRRGHCDADVVVVMPGGAFDVQVSDAFDVVVGAPVARVAAGTLSDAWVRAALAQPALDR